MFRKISKWLIWSKFYAIMLFILVLWFSIYRYTSYEQAIELYKNSNNSSSEKNDFLLDVKSYKNLSKETYIKKIWKTSSSQDISLNANAIWRVSKINVKQWDFVYKNQILAVLEDNIWNYGINLSRAETWLERAKINLESQTIILDKQIEDSKLNLEKLEKNYEALKKTIEKNITKAKNDLENSDYENLDSKSSLDLQKMDNTISKLELDYENLLVSNSETLESFLSSLKTNHNSLKIFIDDIVDFWDRLLWVSDLHKNDELINRIKDYLWVKDKWQKNDTKIDLTNLILYRGWEFDNFEFSNTGSIQDYIDILNEWFELSISYLNNFQDTLNNSIDSLWTLSSTDISTYLSSVNVYQSTLQWNYSSFIAFDNQASSFLRTYKNNEESMYKQIELTKDDREILKKSLWIWEFNADIWYNTTLISSADSLNNLELSIKNAKSNLKNAKKTKEVSIKSLQNAIDDAYISYLSASKEYNKLTIKSPIDWVIWDVFIDLWQEINNQTPVFSISNKKSKEIIVSFSQKELNFINIWQEVSLEFSEGSYTWTIYSISNIADDNLNYKTVVVFPQNLDLLWELVNVRVPVELKYTLVPVNIIKVISDSKWILNIYNDWIIEEKELELGEVWWEYIEILSDLPDDLDIITSDISNFDDAKFKIKIEK